MKIALITANMGNFDKDQNHEKQNTEYDYHQVTDENFPPRICTMTPRLQARIPKMSAIQMFPGYDYYVWLDSSCRLSKENSLETLIDKCKDTDMVIFKHPDRDSIQAEADYLKIRLNKNCPYITPRYKNELIDEQLKVIQDDKDYIDDKLYASTCIVYKNKTNVDNMMKEWWYHTSRYHSIDQLSFPYVIWKNKCTTNIITERYTKFTFLEYIRNK